MILFSSLTATSIPVCGPFTHWRKTLDARDSAFLVTLGARLLYLFPDLVPASCEVFGEANMRMRHVVCAFLTGNLDVDQNAHLCIFPKIASELCDQLRGRKGSPRTVNMYAHQPTHTSMVSTHVAMKKVVIILNWSGQRGSNSRPRRWQRRALPTELCPHYPLI